MSSVKGITFWLTKPKNPFPKNPALTKAFRLADHHHRGQERKGGAPYITHPIAVAKILEKAGYSENVVAAGLLHDVLEDTGCEFEEMERAVGPVITRIVCEVTETNKTLRWPERKESYLKALKTASMDALAVSCADKTHNVASLMEGMQNASDDFLKKFSGNLEQKIKNYTDIYQLIQSRYPTCPLLPEFARHLARVTVISKTA